MIREIVLDTETTGLSPAEGDRLVEIGCVELINHIPTGKNYHAYIDPQRDMPEQAFRVHGLSEEFLSQQPVFSRIVEDFLAFIGDARLVIHNAAFDMSFLNAELEKAGCPPLDNPVLDTVALARRKHPGARVSLDALCKHYGVDNSRRSLHGALLDSEILAEIYLELLGGKQVSLALNAQDETEGNTSRARPPAPSRPTPLAERGTPDERDAHVAFVKTLGANAIWARYDA